LVGFREVDSDDRGDRCPGKQCSEAYLRFRRLWNGQADAQFAIHSRAPLVEPTKRDAIRVEAWMRSHRRFSERSFVAVSPFSNCSSKDLHFKTAAELLKRLENEAGAEAVIVGGAKDAAAASSLIGSAGAGINACGVFSIGEAAALLRECRLAITVDSGPMHLAAAVGTPTVVVYSRTNPHLDRWFPLGTGHTILYREAPCAGCGEQICPVAGHPCIDDIPVEEILEAALYKLQCAPAPSLRTGTRMMSL
jgi:ADP-heptose:LPS heptosyltransferase